MFAFVADFSVFIIIVSAERRLLQDNLPRLRQTDQCRAIRIHGIPATIARLSLHHITSLLRLSVRRHYLQSVWSYRPSLLRAICLTHCYLNLTILLATSVTLVLHCLVSFKHLYLRNPVISLFDLWPLAILASNLDSHLSVYRN